jgi:serine protease Do
MPGRTVPAAGSTRGCAKTVDHHGQYSMLSSVRSRRRSGWPITVCLIAVYVAVVCVAASTVRASELRRDSIVKAIQRAQPAVVNIHGEKDLRSTETRLGALEGQRRVNGMGTGVIVDERGYILTNFHVVDGVEQIQVTLAGGEPHVARLVASDAPTDLAIIKIDPDKSLPVIEVGTSSDLMLGEPVIAVGNAYGYENTVTRGIISALHRKVQVTDAQIYDDLIQTDASINPGNSGGPLINIDGEMIGLNVAVRAGAMGIGFAIPVDKAMAVAGELLTIRRIDETWHGAKGGEEDGSAAGFVVAKVADDSPAAATGLAPGDVVTAAAGRPVKRALAFERAVLGRQAGDEVPLSIKRGEEQLALDLVLDRVPKAALSTDDPTWDVLGLRLEPIAPKDFQQYKSRYRGGLTVKDVRKDGPAATQGIRRGDVLVGMHIWETISLENISYILNRPDVDGLGPLKFYILRGDETLFGHMTVSLRKEP